MISPQVLYAWLQSDSPPVLVDVRSDEDYAAGHIPGALHHPAHDTLDLLQHIPRSRPVVVY